MNRLRTASFLPLALASAWATCAPQFVAGPALGFQHDSGMQGEMWMVEIMGSGVGVFDFDNDGWLDIWLVQGGPIRDRSGTLPRDRLYRNVSNGGPLRFEDVTDQAGVAATGYGLGIATGDIDHDGDLDVLVANFGENQLYENLGNGRFRDITAGSGLSGDELSVSASFADINDDGLVDLYITNYVRFSLETHRPCRREDGSLDYCGPKAYPPETDKLYINLGGGRFRDATRDAGIDQARGAGLGVVANDFDGDGDTDWFVANDQSENLLWLNQGNARFVDDGLFAGIAVNGDGIAEASMGIAAADYDHDGDVDLFMTHLTGETNTLYANDGTGLFTDISAPSGIALSSLAYTGFGTAWFDVDNDGDLDLFSANGAVLVIPDQQKAGIPVPLRQRNQLWLNDGSGHYDLADGGPAFESEAVSRGAAFGDLDNDGDIDIVISNNHAEPQIYRNDTPGGHWLGLDLDGGPQSPLASGASVWLTEHPEYRRRIGTDGSYASANDPRLLFGLGPRAIAQSVEVRWPDGNTERFESLAPDRYHRLTRGHGKQ
ncbi:MAG: CRTAC1 family protein [Proteobacteria bacterium]|jgi:hypothetical protein|nr:CRTAC1 family protein [Pseudomonadota bacterium]MDA1298668.1 CRTAC1 family protein [Pseudomonadota bacterium]